MKFKYCISSLANQFFFISNLSEWHFSCCKFYNKAWIEKTGKLTEEENKALKEFKKIILRYGYEKNKYLGISFFSVPEKNIWVKVKNHLRPKEYDTMRWVFKIFNPRFKKIWPQEKRQLKIIRKILKSQTEKITSLFLEDICNLFKIDKKYFLKKHLAVFLLISKKDSIGGGANLKGFSITIECSGWDYNNKKRIILFIYHELIHILLKNSKYYNELIRKYLALKGITDKNIFELFNELVISSFIPEGYLSEKYFNKDIQKIALKKIAEAEKNRDFLKNLSSLKYFIAYHLYPWAKKYISQKKRIDLFYMDKVWKTYNFYPLEKKLHYPSSSGN